MTTAPLNRRREPRAWSCAEPVNVTRERGGPPQRAWVNDTSTTGLSLILRSASVPALGEALRIRENERAPESVYRVMRVEPYAEKMILLGCAADGAEGVYPPVLG